ncbi:MAG: ABC transporter substrate-binding protein [Nitrolancea sp.]
MSFSLSRRRLILASMAIPVAGLLDACGGGSSSTPTTAPAASTSTSGSSATAAATPTPIQSSGVAPSKSTESASPSATEASSGQVADVDFIVVDGTETSSLDPCVGTAYQYAVNAIFNKLVVWNAQMNVEPSLATSWSVSDDHSEWTFQLRPNVKFHDGTPFNSAAVKATIDHILDPDTKANRRANYSLIKEVKTPDDLTAVFVTDPPTPDFPFLMADGSANIISPTALQKYGSTEFGRHPVGTGPFVFEEWVPNDHISATANPDYWGPKPLVKRFVYKPVPDAATRVIVLKSGQADVVFGLPPADIPDLQKESNLKIVNDPGITIVQMQLKQAVKPFSELGVRQAVNMAVDKDSIIKNVMQGLARPLKTPDNPGLWGAFEFDPLPFDPDKAKSLLSDAGYPNGFEVTISYTSGRWPGDDQTVEAVQSYLGQVGIKATIKKGDQAAFVADLTKDPATNPTLMVMPQRTSYYTDYQLFRLYQSDAANADAAQRSGYHNDEVDKLLAQERSEFDPDKRLQLFQQVEKLIWDDTPFLYLFSRNNVYGQSTKVSGFTVLPSGDMTPGELTKG